MDEYFGTVSGDDNWIPRYNIAPSQPVVTIRQDAREPVRKLSTMRWGLVSVMGERSEHGIQDDQRAGRPLQRLLRSGNHSNRSAVLIPADGFYEWRRQGKAKQPYCFR